MPAEAVERVIGQIGKPTPALRKMVLFETVQCLPIRALAYKRTIVKTPRGGAWHPELVKRVGRGIRRYEAYRAGRAATAGCNGMSGDAKTICYRYSDNPDAPHAILPTFDMAHLWSPLKSVIDARYWPDRRAFDLGCGNGATCKMLSSLAFDAVGVDVSESGIAIAQANGVKAYLGSAYDDLAATYGTFPLVVSLEVIEHCIDPRTFTKTFLSLIAPGGIGFLSTPYHGYLKNLALAVSGKMDSHFGALWDGGHVKFFSMKTLRKLLKEAGTTDLQLLRVGRIPVFAKSIVAIVQKPLEWRMGVPEFACESANRKKA